MAVGVSRRQATCADFQMTTPTPRLTAALDLVRKYKKRGAVQRPCLLCQRVNSASARTHVDKCHLLGEFDSSYLHRITLRTSLPVRVGRFLNRLLVEAAPGQLRPDRDVRLAPGHPVFVQPFFLKLRIQWGRHDAKGVVGLSYSALPHETSLGEGCCGNFKHQLCQATLPVPGLGDASHARANRIDGGKRLRHGIPMRWPNQPDHFFAIGQEDQGRPQLDPE